MSTPMRIPEGKIVLTYEDYILLPNDGNRYEIYLLNVDSYHLAATLQGKTPVSAPPFAELMIKAKSIFI